MVVTSDVGTAAKAAIRRIVSRYSRYEEYLSLPMDLGERAVRGWLAFELLGDVLAWPSANIVLGERLDVLLVDQGTRPRIYLETKKPGRGLAELEDFKERRTLYGTFRFMVITDCHRWLRYEVLGECLGDEITLNEEGPAAEFRRFFSPLHASRFLHEVSSSEF